MTIEVPIGDERVAACHSTSDLPPHRMCTGDKPNCVNPRMAKTTVVLLEHGFYDNQVASKVLLIPHTGMNYRRFTLYVLFYISEHLYLFTCQFTYLFTCLSMYLFIDSYLFVHLFYLFSAEC